MLLKTAVFTGLLLLSTACTGQFKKGDRMAGASVGTVVVNSGNSDITVASIGSNTSKITSYNISILPSLGWFISDRTVAGAEVNINPRGDKTTYEQSATTYQSDKQNSFSLGFGGFVRHYFNQSGSLTPFVQFGLNAGINNLKTEGFFYGGGSGSGSYKLTYEGNSTGGFFMNSTFRGGFTKMLSDNTGLDLYIGYNFSYNKNVFKKTTLRDDGNNGTIDSRLENETTTKFTNHGFLIGAGFQVFIRGKKK